MIARLVDSHVHFWHPDLLRYNWLSALPALNRPFGPADLLAEAGDLPLERIVFVQADCATEDTLREVEWVSSLAAADPRIQGIVAFAALEQTGVAHHLANLRGNPLVKGVRRLIQSEEVEFAAQPDFVRGVRLLAEYGLSFDICIRHEQLPAVIMLVGKCPDVHFVLDHAGKPGIRDHLMEPWAANIRQLADFSNVTCKLSGLVTEADVEKWTLAGLQPYIDTVLAAFGPNRVMFGGDWPVAKLAANYIRWAEAAETAIGALSEAERDKVFYTNACDFYHLG